MGAEFITVSCIRTAEDVMEVRKLLGSSRIKLLSKIENKAGADNFESILKISDGKPRMKKYLPCISGRFVLNPVTFRDYN